jgi:hypothetical protein
MKHNDNIQYFVLQNIMIKSEVITVENFFLLYSCKELHCNVTFLHTLCLMCYMKWLTKC